MNDAEREEQRPIIKIPRSAGDIAIGDYVFACRWHDADPGDPWVIGHVSEINDSAEDVGYVKVGDCSQPFRCWPRAVKITQKQAERILMMYPVLEKSVPTNYDIIAKVWRG